MVSKDLLLNHFRRVPLIMVSIEELRSYTSKGNSDWVFVKLKGPHQRLSILRSLLRFLIPRRTKSSALKFYFLKIISSCVSWEVSLSLATNVQKCCDEFITENHHHTLYAPAAQ